MKKVSLHAAASQAFLNPSHSHLPGCVLRISQGDRWLQVPRSQVQDGESGVELI